MAPDLIISFYPYKNIYISKGRAFTRRAFFSISSRAADRMRESGRGRGEMGTLRAPNTPSAHDTVERRGQPVKNRRLSALSGVDFG